MKKYRVGFLMLHSLGHITHYQRMQLEVAKDPEIQAVWMPIFPWKNDRWQKLPIVRTDYGLLSALRARDELGHHPETFDALFCHSYQGAVLLGKYTKRIPTILSLDGTPINSASFGQAFHHSKRLKHLKHFLIKRTFQRAPHLVTFNGWARDSLIEDYGISGQKITVISPGLDLNLWNVTPEERGNCKDDWVPRVLFVGGDFRRKGGELLVKCAAAMQGELSVDIVTSESIPSAEGFPNIRIHRGLKTGTPELMALYRKADLFVLPTLGDMSPFVIMEAMAMRLPVVATPVGGIPELVVHGQTGLLIPPNSPKALTEAILELSNDPERRRQMGDAGRRRLELYFDGARNYRALIALIKSIADR